MSFLGGIFFQEKQEEDIHGIVMSHSCNLELHQDFRGPGNMPLFLGVQIISRKIYTTTKTHFYLSCFLSLLPSYYHLIGLVTWALSSKRLEIESRNAAQSVRFFLVKRYCHDRSHDKRNAHQASVGPALSEPIGRDHHGPLYLLDFTAHLDHDDPRAEPSDNTESSESASKKLTSSSYCGRTLHLVL